MDNISNFISLVGIPLGALFAGLGYYLKSRAERLKSLKLVLYYLLEIRYIMCREAACEKLIADDYLKYCIEFLEGRGIRADNDFINPLEPMIREHISSLTALSRVGMDAEFLLSFDGALSDLSKDNPVLAYLIRGSNNLKSLISLQKAYVSNVKEAEVFEDSLVGHVVKSKIGKMQDESIGSIIKDLSRLVSLVSMRAGIFDWWRCRRICKKPVESSVNFKDVGLDKYLQECLDAVVAEVDKQVNQHSERDSTTIS